MTFLYLCLLNRGDYNKNLKSAVVGSVIFSLKLNILLKNMFSGCDGLKYKRRKSNVSKYICLSDEKNQKRKLKKFMHSGKLRAACIFALVVFSLSRFSFIDKADVKTVFTQTSGGKLKNVTGFFDRTGNTIADLCKAVFQPAKEEKTNAFAETESPVLSDAAKEKTTDSILQEVKPVFSPTNPCPGRISSEFGERVHPLNNSVSFHNGIDIAGEEGSEIRACFDGIVETSEYNEFSGNYIIIDHGDGYTSSYAHMKECIAKKGEAVKKGQLIGLMGATGNATGPHLHFEIRKDGTALNPMELIGN